MINLAILGLGTVGAGTLNLIQENLSEIKRRMGHDIRITHVGTRRERPDLNLTGINQSADLMDIVTKDDVDIVVEVIGGTTLAKDITLHAIKHGKHIVTANKALIAEHGNELFKVAEENNVQIAYEASVAGGIPIIKVLRESLTGNKINWLSGIINGTGNFIMTEMREKGRPFADVLAEAQELGYAESDPTFDVEGIDAAHKLTILASIAFGIPLQFDKVYCEGISKITPKDITYADELGYRIKHLGFAKKVSQTDGNEAIELRVHPTLVPVDKLLANVNGVKNAVMVDSDALGESLYYGAGAGAGPTASAIVADVLDLVRMVAGSKTSNNESSEQIPHLAFQPDSLADTKVVDISEITSAYYLRVTSKDEKGVLAKITSILSENSINIDAIIQKSGHTDGLADIVITTENIKEAIINNAIIAIEKLDVVHEDVMRIRLEKLS